MGSGTSDPPPSVGTLPLSEPILFYGVVLHRAHVQLHFSGSLVAFVHICFVRVTPSARSWVLFDP